VEKIEIEVLEDVPSGSRRFNVRTDGRLADGLGFDEMLGLVASLTMPERRPCLHWMKKEEELAARQAKVQSGEVPVIPTPASGPLTDKDALDRPWVMVRDHEMSSWHGPAVFVDKLPNGRYVCRTRCQEGVNVWFECRRATDEEIEEAELEV